MENGLLVITGTIFIVFCYILILPMLYSVCMGLVEQGPIEYFSKIRKIFKFKKKSSFQKVQYSNWQMAGRARNLNLRNDMLVVKRSKRL